MLVARGRLEHRQAIVRIGVQQFTPQAPGVEPQQSSLTLPIQAYRALIDTGAQRTCLTNRAIAEQKLQRHGKRLIKNVHSEALHGLFFANIGIFVNGVTEHYENQESYYALQGPVEIINIGDNAGFDAILGMDVLSGCDLFLDRHGDFEIRL